MSERYLEAARRVVGLIDAAGYALCARCKARLENDDKIYCSSCDDVIIAEKMAGVFKP